LQNAFSIEVAKKFNCGNLKKQLDPKYTGNKDNDGAVVKASP